MRNMDLDKLNLNDGLILGLSHFFATATAAQKSTLASNVVKSDSK